MVIPVRDETTITVAAHLELFTDVTELFLAEESVVRRLMDKKLCMKAAEEIDVPIPMTYHPDEDGIEAVRNEATFPVLIKPRIASGARGIVRVDDPDQLIHKYKQVSRDHADPIIQEFVDHSGGHYSIGTVFNDESEPVATHVYRETRQYPSSGGPAITAHTVERGDWVDPILELLRAEEWKGPAHMDVLRDPVTGEYKLIEVNPRFWSSLSLTVRSGVDIPLILYKIAVEDTVPDSDEPYVEKMNYRWVLPNEILSVLSGNRRLHQIKSLLTNRNRPVCYGVLSRRDPLVVVGVATQSLDFILHEEKRNEIFDRGW